MSSIFNPIKSRKQFGDPGYMIPEVEALSTALPQDEEDDERFESGVVPVPEQPITEAMRASLMGVPDPIEENTRTAMKGIQSGPDVVPMPESLKPRGLKQALKDTLLGMIPGYGPAHVISQSERRKYDAALYKQEMDREEAEYKVRKEAAMSWHDAKIKQDQEVSTRQAKIKLFLQLFPNAAPTQIMRAAGIQLPTAKQVKFETRKVRVFGSDGATPSDWVSSEYNPATGTYTYRDPETKNLVTAPIDLIADVQKIGTPTAGSDPLGTKITSLENALGRKLTEPELLEMASIGEGNDPSKTPLDRLQYQLEQKVEAGTATPEDLRNLRAATRTRLTVPGFTSGAADNRSLQAQAASFKRSFMISQIVKRYNWVADAVNFASKINPNSKNAGDHMAIIYQFAKTMDPESVVREGEYATVKKYAQAWKDQFGLNLMRIVDNKGLLEPNAIKKLQKTMIDRYNSTKQEYVNYRSEMGKMLDEHTQTEGNEATLPDYGAAFPGLGSNPNLRVQRSKKTKKMRYSLDGGRTWQNGNPPQ